MGTHDSGFVQHAVVGWCPDGRRVVVELVPVTCIRHQLTDEPGVGQRVPPLILHHLSRRQQGRALANQKRNSYGATAADPRAVDENTGVLRPGVVDEGVGAVEARADVVVLTVVCVQLLVSLDTRLGAVHVLHSLVLVHTHTTGTVEDVLDTQRLHHGNVLSISGCT